MAYIPTNWKTGDIVFSERLNKIENGIAGAGGGILVVTATGDDVIVTLDKTWKQIFDADFAVIINETQGDKTISLVREVHIDDGQYVVQCARDFDIYVATSENGYPSIAQSPK